MNTLQDLILFYKGFAYLLQTIIKLIKKKENLILQLISENNQWVVNILILEFVTILIYIVNELIYFLIISY